MNELPKTGLKNRQQHFEHLLSREAFIGLKAILDKLSEDREALCEAVNGGASFETLLPRLGYQLVLTKQIHVQDAYTRVSKSGGIKAVLPYHDIPTQSSLPVLVNHDATVTMTNKSAAFFNHMLAAFKAQLQACPA